MRGLFEPFDQHQIHARHAGKVAGQLGLGLIAQLMHQGPTRGRGQHDLAGPGGAMAETVAPGLVDIDIVMGPLDGRDGKPPPRQLCHEAFNKGGFPAAMGESLSDPALRCLFG